MTPNWAGSRFSVVALGRIVEVQLGKMLQPARSTMVDELTPYLRAGSLSKLDTDDFPEMFASPLDRRKYEVVKGDLLVAEGGDVGRAEFARAIPATTIIQNSLHRLRARTTDMRFIKYALDAVYGSGWLEVYCSKSTFGHLTREKLTALTIPSPSPAMQRAIADYLDAETARIDLALDLRRRTITLLDEASSAVLNAAFASASTRRTKLKHLLAQSPCYGVLVPNFVEVGVPFVRVGDLASMGSEEAPARYISESQSREYARTRLALGDILLSVVGSIDKVRVVSLALVDSNIARAVCRLVPRAGLPSDLLALWFRSTAYLDQARQATSSDTAQPTLGMGDLSNFEVWFPDSNAYDEFKIDLQKELDRLRASRDSLQRQVELLAERRQALITAAVTGQIEIPGVAV